MGNELAPQLSLEELMAKSAAKTKADVDALTNAPTMAEALALLGPMLPQPTRDVSRSPIVAALSAHPDPNAGSQMLETLRSIVGGPLSGKPAWNTALSDEKRAVVFALLEALHRRGSADDALFTVWIDHPDHLLRNHERVRAARRPDLDERLAALVGQLPDADSQRWSIEALFAIDPGGAAGRATKLLEGDAEKLPGALEGIRGIASYLQHHAELRSPAWEKWLRSALIDHFEAFDLERVCELLVTLGDAAVIPALQEKLAKAVGKVERKQIEEVITKLGGEPQAKPKGNCIEPAPSGRAACRGCRDKIAKDELRFGMAVTNVFSESGDLAMRWYHLRCAAEKASLAFGPTLEAYAGEVPEREALKKSIADAMAKRRRPTRS